jgi:hypothetical protein
LQEQTQTKNNPQQGPQPPTYLLRLEQTLG